jgi:hypothetical protein
MKKLFAALFTAMFALTAAHAIAAKPIQFGGPLAADEEQSKDDSKSTTDTQKAGDDDKDTDKDSKKTD